MGFLLRRAHMLRDLHGDGDLGGDVDLVGDGDCDGDGDHDGYDIQARFGKLHPTSQNSNAKEFI